MESAKGLNILEHYLVASSDVGKRNHIISLLDLMLKECGFRICEPEHSPHFFHLLSMVLQDCASSFL